MRHPLEYDPSEVLVSTLTMGGSGSGKTLSSAPKYVWAARERICGIVAKDKHGHLIREIARHGPELGYKSRLRIDELRNFKRVLPGITIRQSDDPDPYRRDAMNNVTILECMDFMWAASGRGDGEGAVNIHDMPALSMAADMAIRIMLFQPVQRSFADMGKLVLLGRDAQEMVNDTTDEEAKVWWRDVLRYHREHKDRLVEERAGAMRRLWRQVSHPAMLVRCGTEDVWEEVILGKQIVLIDGSDDGSVHPRAATAVYRGMNLSIFQTMMRLYTKTRKENLLLHVWEEAAATDLLGTAEQNFLREGRKTGWRPHIITQDDASFSDETRAVIRGCTIRHEYYNLGNKKLALEAAEDIAYGGNLDPDLIAFEEESVQQLHAGYKFEKRRSTTTTKVPEGSDRKSEGEAEVAVPQYETIVKKHKHLRSLDDQVKLGVQEILTMPPGWRKTRQGTHASGAPELVLLLEDSYSEDTFPGLFHDRIYPRLVAESQAKAPFITPAEKEPCKTSGVSSTSSKSLLPTNGQLNVQSNGQVNGQPPRRRKGIAPSLRLPQNTRSASNTRS